jgi:hypothetical protein
MQGPAFSAGSFIVAEAFIARLGNKGVGTGFRLEHPVFPVVVGAGNTNTVRRD